jgi:hypothetical protein
MERKPTNIHSRYLPVSHTITNTLVVGKALSFTQEPYTRKHTTSSNIQHSRGLIAVVRHNSFIHQWPISPFRTQQHRNEWMLHASELEVTSIVWRLHSRYTKNSLRGKTTVWFKDLGSVASTPSVGRKAQTIHSGLRGMWQAANVKDPQCFRQGRC